MLIKIVFICFKQACSAFNKNFTHYISYETNSKDICYISQTTPFDQVVFSLVRKACLRTLHCEVIEDPIYFDENGKDGSAVVGYEFHVKDSEGRGHQRSYSIIFLMRDRIYLQQLFLFLQPNLVNIANKIKESAQIEFEKEMGSSRHTDFQTGDQMPSPPPAPVASTLTETKTTRRSSFSNRCFRDKPTTRKPAAKTLRGLAELTNDPEIFGRLHMWFTWLLRVSALRIREECYYGPISEDQQIKVEKFKYLTELDETLQEKVNSLNLNLNLNKNKNEEQNISINIKMENLRDLLKVGTYATVYETE